MKIEQSDGNKNLFSAGVMLAMFIVLTGCAMNEPIDPDLIAESDEIPPGPGIVEAVSGQKLKVEF